LKNEFLEQDSSKYIPKYKGGVDGKKIYEAVLVKGVGSIDEFEKFLQGS